MTTQEIRFRLAVDGAGQVQAGMAGVGQAMATSAADAARLQQATTAAAAAQIAYDQAITRSTQAQAAYSAALKAAGTSQATLTDLAQKSVAAQAAQANAGANLKQQTSALNGLTQAHAQLGAQSKLTGNQTAQLSAQLQDLFVQIQAGGSPMTALIQQGSQLSAVFGGVKPALQAVGTIITPTVIGLGTLLGSVAALGAAYNQGANESAAYARALTLSGSAAGATAGQLNELAKSQAAVAGSRGQAAEVLTQLVATGNVAAAQLGKATDAAIRFERAGGGAIDDTIKKFNDLGRAPLATLLKLNEAENFLTRSVYDQVKALEARGKASEAAAVAQNTYFDSINGKTPKLEAQLGSLEKAWRAVGEGAKAAWNAMLDIGRPATLEDQLKATEKKIAELEAARNIDRGGKRKSTYDEQLAAQRQYAENLRQQIYMEREAAAAGQAAAEGNKKYFDTVNDQLAASAARAQGAFAIASEKIKGELADIQSRAARGLLSPIEAIEQTGAKNVQVLQQQAKLQDTLYALAVNRGAKEAELAGLQSQRGTTTVAIANAEAAAKNQVAEAIDKTRKAAELETQAQQEATRAEKLRFDDQIKRGYKDASDQTLAYVKALNESSAALEFETSLLGLNDNARSLALEGYRQELELRKQLQRISETADPIDKDRQSENARTAKARALAAAEARIYAEEWQKRIEQIGDSLTDALLRAAEAGRDGVKSLGDDLVAMFKNMVLRPTIQAYVQQGSGALVSYLTGGASGGGGGGAAGSANNLVSLAGLYNKGSGYVSGLFGNGATASTAGAFADVGGYGAASNAALAEYGISGTASTFAADASVNAALAEYGLASGSASAAAGGTAAAGGASSAAAAIPIIGWIVAGIMASNAAYKGGNTVDMLDDSDKKYGIGVVDEARYKTLSALGLSDKWAQVLSGAPLAARLFGHKASESGFGLGSVQDGDFVQSLSSPLKFGDNTLGGGANDSLQKLASDLAASVALAAGDFGGKLKEGLKIGAFTDNDRKGQASQLIGYFDGDKLTAGTQTGSGTFGAGGPGVAASKMASEDLLKWVSEQMPVLIVQGLQQSDLSARFETYFDSVAGKDLTVGKAQELLQTASAVQALADSFAPIGGVFTQLETASVESIAAFAKGVGGFGQLGQSVASYYQAFYTETEQVQNASDQVAKALAEVGLTMPDVAIGADEARKQFRALVDQQKIGTEEGDKALTTLFKVSGAFNAVATAADDAAKKTAEEAKKKAKADADAEAEANKKILAQREDLQTQLLELQGDTIALRNREREALDQSNRALYDQVQALRAQKSAAESAAAANAQLADVLDSLVSTYMSAAERALRNVGRAIDFLKDKASNQRDTDLGRLTQDEKDAHTKYDPIIENAATDKRNAENTLAGQLLVKALPESVQAAISATLVAARSQLEGDGNTNGTAYDAVNQALTAAASLEDAQAGLEAAGRARESAFTTALQGIETSIKAQQIVVNDLRDLSGALGSTIASLQPADSEVQQRTDAQRFIREALATAQLGGALPATKDISGALSTLARPSQDGFASESAYLKDFYSTRNDLVALQEITDSKLTIEELQLKTLEEVKTTLVDDNDRANSLLEQQLDAIRLQEITARRAYDAIVAAAEKIAGQAELDLAGALKIIDGKRELIDTAYEKRILELNLLWEGVQENFNTLTGATDAITDVGTALDGLATALLPLAKLDQLTTDFTGLPGAMKTAIEQALLKGLTINISGLIGTTGTTTGTATGTTTGTTTGTGTTAGTGTGTTTGTTTSGGPYNGSGTYTGSTDGESGLPGGQGGSTEVITGTGAPPTKVTVTTDANTGIKTFTDPGGAYGLIQAGQTGSENVLVHGIDGSNQTAAQWKSIIEAGLLSGDYAGVEAKAKPAGLTDAGLEAIAFLTPGSWAALKKGDAGMIGSTSIKDIIGTLDAYWQEGGPEWQLPGAEKARTYAVSRGLSSYTLDAILHQRSGAANDLAAQFGLPAFATGGDHLGGLRIVGERGWEVEATGPSRIFTADQLMQAVSDPSRANDALVAEIRRLHDRLAAMEGVLEKAGINIEKMTRLQDGWDINGLQVNQE